MTRSARKYAVGAAVALTVALAGCGSDESTVTVPAQEKPSASADATEDAAGDEAALRADLEVGSTPQSLDDAEQAVLDSYVRYWKVRVASYAAALVDPESLGEVAYGEPAATIQQYVAELAANGHHTEGTSTLHISSIEVVDTTALVTACLDDRSANVSDTSGEPVEQPAGRLAFQAQLTGSGATWLVAQHQRTGTC